MFKMASFTYTLGQMCRARSDLQPFRNKLCNATSIILVIVQSILEHWEGWYKKGEEQGRGEKKGIFLKKSFCFIGIWLC